MVPREDGIVKWFVDSKCTVSGGAPVAAEISSAITFMDWVQMISTNCALKVVQVASVDNASG